MCWSPLSKSEMSLSSVTESNSSAWTRVSHSHTGGPRRSGNDTTLEFERFELLAMAGSGASGQVYRALDLHTGQPVALKIIEVVSANTRARFEREAAALAELDHPGIVRYVDHGELGDKRCYLAMEWLEGLDLRARLIDGPLGPSDARVLAERLAAALGAVHAAGTIHRDIKPSNIFLVDGDVAQAKLVDFGVARSKLLETGYDGVTRDGTLIGTPLYMSPEQARTQTLGPASDVWSLGVVLYESLTGSPPFNGDELPAVLARILLDEPTQLRVLAPEISAGLADVVHRALTKRVEQRPANGYALLELLRGAGASVPMIGAH